MPDEPSNAELGATWCEIVELIVANRQRLGLGRELSDDELRRVCPTVFVALVEIVTTAKREGNDHRLEAFAWFVDGMANIAHGPAPGEPVH